MMRPNPKVFEALSRMTAAKEEVRLINDHRGIPVTYMASIEGFKEFSVIFKVNKYQCVCLELERFTYLQSPSLPSILKAKVADLDIVNTLVSLKNFEPASDTIGRRTVIRVQPKDPVDVVILYQGQKIRGSLVDVSSSGIGIYMVSAYIYNPGLLRKNERIQLTIRLPNEKGGITDIRIPGTILYVNREKGSFRLGISTNPEPHAQTTISQFITQTQAEIMRELKTLYDTFYRIKVEGKESH
jgi:hypothetical protein